MQHSECDDYSRKAGVLRDRRLITIMGVILIISLISVFIVVNQSMRPLEEFTEIASDLADGKVDQKIESNSNDEIGRLADVLERLRISLKVAMERLSRQQ